jgi:methyl-accepting chemotaxis protein
MTIKSKLALNVLFVILIVVALSSVSIYGLTSVRRNLSYLLATSTPYQVRTTDLQRTLQGAVSDLIKSSGASNGQELKLYRDSFVGSMAELKQAEEDLERISGRSGGIYKELDNASNEVFDVTQKRLQSESDAQEANKIITARLKEMTVALGQLDAKVVALQKSNTQSFNGAFESSKKVAIRLKVVESGKSTIESLQSLLLTLQYARERKQAIILKSKINGLLDQLLENQVITESKEMLTATRAVKQKISDLTDAHASLLKQPDDSTAKQKMETMVAELRDQLATVSTTLNQNADAAAMEATSATKRQDTSFTQANTASGALNSNAALIAAGLSLEGEAARLFGASSDAEVDKLLGEINSVLSKVPKYRSSLEKGLVSIGAKTETTLLSSAIAKLNGVRDLLIAKDGVASKVRTQLEMKRKARELDDRLRRMVQTYTEAGKKELLTAHKGQEDSAASANKTVRFSIILNIAFGAVSILMAALLGVILYRSIVRPVVKVKELIESAERENSLTRRLDHIGKDEIGEMSRCYNTFLDRLQNTISQISDMSNHVSDSSRELSVTSAQMVGRANSQAEQTAGIATATEEMSATVNDVSNNTLSAADFSHKLKSSVLEGGEIIRHAIDGIKSVAKTIKDATGTIDGLSNESERIGEIVSVINDIADQTNLLALNAAIEAARAGEQGRGFAVVADEVRKLAARTTTATGEIAAMIHSIQSESGNVAKSMARGIGEAESGVLLANQAGEALEKIVEGIEEVAEMISQIATASQEQTATIEVISTNIHQVSEVTDDFASGMKQSAASAENLDQLAKGMKQLVGQFRI